LSRLRTGSKMSVEHSCRLESRPAARRPDSVGKKKEVLWITVSLNISDHMLLCQGEVSARLLCEDIKTSFNLRVTYFC